MATSQQRSALWAERLHLVVQLLLIIGFTVIAILFLAGVLPLIYAIGIPALAIAAGTVLPFLRARVRR